MKRELHVPYSVTQDEDGGWAAAEVGAPDELTVAVA